ncbi:hypothetical protein E8E13_000611 [Curvularia kusanoi]|uniref:Transcription factor domain-containing protein n=1 Tax=Curvularia kusanoi TaxID=90978 RepID=A0A9P4T4W8_CURKU|nr:hypothetical protein E8E13_000611 [Curvularia kusanoi]
MPPASPSSPRPTVAETIQLPRRIVVDSAHTLDDVQRCLDRTPSFSSLTVEANITDQDPTCVNGREQQHGFETDLMTPPQASPVRNDVSSQDFDFYADPSHETDALLPRVASSGGSHQQMKRLSLGLFFQDDSFAPPLGESVDDGVDSALVLESVAVPLTEDVFFTNLTQQPSVECQDLDSNTAVAELAESWDELNMPNWASWSWQHNIWTDYETENLLTTHYFNRICQIMSCFDSRQNPFRKNIPQMMLTCGYIQDCVSSLSAAHLANSICGMESVAIRHQTKALRSLMTVIQAIQDSDCYEGNNSILSHFSAKYARRHALLAALLLGISTAWFDASASSLTHHFGARLLFQAWLVDEGICANSQDISQADIPLDSEQCFIIGAMVYFECLTSIIVDQPSHSLNYLFRFARPSQGQRFYPNPWTGISTPLFVYLAATAALLRRRRCWELHSGKHSFMDTDIIETARELLDSVLAHESPMMASVDDTQDASTPLGHLFAVDAIFRLVILLELIQAFPDLVADHHSNRVLDLAIAILIIISDLPESSGVNVMLSIPLLSAGSALQASKSITGSVEQLYDLNSTSFCALFDQVATILHHPFALQTWRDQVTWRFERMYHRVGLAPVKRVRSLLDAVWFRADETNNIPTIHSDKVHWMDVMAKEGLETLFG